MSIDAFIGTGGPGWGAGSLNPGAQFPHGTLRLGPDTSALLLANLTLLTLPFQHYGGYSYSDNVIRGFSQAPTRSSSAARALPTCASRQRAAASSASSLTTPARRTCMCRTRSSTARRYSRHS